MRMYIAMSVLVVAALGAVSLHAAEAISLDGEWSLRKSMGTDLWGWV